LLPLLSSFLSIYYQLRDRTNIINSNLSIDYQSDHLLLEVPILSFILGANGPENVIFMGFWTSAIDRKGVLDIGDSLIHQLRPCTHRHGWSESSRIGSQPHKVRGLRWSATPRKRSYIEDVKTESPPVILSRGPIVLPGWPARWVRHSRLQVVLCINCRPPKECRVTAFAGLCLSLARTLGCFQSDPIGGIRPERV